MNLLHIIQNTFINLVELSYQHHKKVLLLFITTLLILMSQFKPLELHLTIDQLINKDFQSSIDYFNLKKEFHLKKSATVIISTSNDHFSAAEFCHFRNLTQSLTTKYPEFSNFFSPLYLRETQFKANPEIPTLNFPYAISLNCDQFTSNSSPFVSFKGLEKSPWNKAIIAKNQKSFLHEFEIEKNESPNFENEYIPLKSKQIMEHFQSLDPNLTQRWFGDITYQNYFKQGLDYNNALNALIVLIIGIIFYFYFGTFLSTCIFLFTVIISSLLLFSLMSLFKVPIDILNNCLVLLLTVSSLGDFVFLSANELQNEGHWLNSFKKIITPSFFTSFTTFIGFVSLCTSDIEVIRRLGLWGGLSGMIEWFTVMILLPPVLKVFIPNKKWVKINKRQQFNFLENFFQKYFNKQVATFLLLFILTIPFSIKHLNVNDEPDKLFKKHHPFRETIQHLSDNFNFKGEVSLVFKDKNQIELNQKKLKDLQQFKIVSRIENPYLGLAYFSSNAPKNYQALIEDSLKSTPQFKRLFSDNKARAVIFLKEVNMIKLEELRKDVNEKICHDKTCYLSGSLISYADFSQKVPHTLIESFIVSIFLVVLIIIFLAYYAGQTKHIFKLALTSIWGVSITLLLIAVFQIQMNFVTCVVISILVGMTGDNSIQYILGSMETDLTNGLKTRAFGSILNTLTMMSCSAIFILYYFEPPKTFGLLLILGLFMALVGDYWILQFGIKELPDRSGDKA